MRRLLVVLAVGLSAACGSTSSGDAGTPATDSGAGADAGPVADAGADAGAWDAGSPADAGQDCRVKTDCPCFSNDDCPAAYTCTSFDPTGVEVYCVPGARGTGVAGTPCSGEGDCASALCVDIRDGGMACSQTCTAVAQCPAPPFSRCLYVGFGVDVSICAP